MTDSTRLVRQTTYYPYAWTLAHAKGQVLPRVGAEITFELPARSYSAIRLARR